MLSLSSINVKRVFSKMNLIKTDLRNRLATGTLNDLVFISYHGPKNIKDFDPQPAIELWKSIKPRKSIS